MIFAQRIGLNTCWTQSASPKMSDRNLPISNRTVILIAVGYGENQGVQHNNIELEEVADIHNAPDWFIKGVIYTLFAPTASNRQNYQVIRQENKVKLYSGRSPIDQINLGILQYHFECGAEPENFVWDC